MQKRYEMLPASEIWIADMRVDDARLSLNCRPIRQCETQLEIILQRIGRHT